MDIPTNLIHSISSKVKSTFDFDMPTDIEWRTSDHPNYEKDKKESLGEKDAGGFITKDWKKIYSNVKMDEDFISHEIGHFFDRHLGHGQYFSHSLDLPQVSNRPHENFAIMVSYVITEGHPGGPVQTKIYNAVKDKIHRTSRLAHRVVIAYRLPSIKSPSLPGSMLEKPTYKAVEELMSEDPISSGWHSGFDNDFNQLEPCWAIIFDGKLSSKAIKAAEGAGLKVKERTGRIYGPDHVLTDVYLPNVGRTNYSKASAVFNKFSDLYKGSGKKVASIINNFINEDAVNIIKTAGYDREKLIPGYEGKFVIHDHSSEGSAGHHFDLRLEFPVTDLHRALKSYIGKRDPGTKEPYGLYPSKPGTVYRSFAVKKHKLPTKDNKLFIVETEDHPGSYGVFKGRIESGYGKGDVDIFDKGTYKLLNVEGDKKYTIDFNGDKLKGVFALIKYNEGFLWVKTSIEKKDS
jgi:bifunctional non-homologous end joining protein LigD